MNSYRIAELVKLHEAIDQAYTDAREHPTGALHYVEVWSGTAIFQSTRRDEATGFRPPAAGASIHIKAHQQRHLDPAIRVTGLLTRLRFSVCTGRAHW
jgi:hypothetical protein